MQLLGTFLIVSSFSWGFGGFRVAGSLAASRAPGTSSVISNNITTKKTSKKCGEHLVQYSNMKLFPFCYFIILMNISSLCSVGVDAIDSHGGSEFHVDLSFLDENNNDHEEDNDQIMSLSSTIVGICLLTTYVIVILFGLVTMRKEIGQVRFFFA